MSGVAAMAALVCSACGTVDHAASTGHSPAPTQTAAAPGGQTTSTTSPTTPGPALPGTGKPPVTIGDKNYTEQFILGQLYLQALEAQGFTATINQNIGPTDVTTHGLETGTLTMYPEYLDVFDTSIAGYRHPFRTRLRAYRAAERFALTHGLSLLDMTPFSDTDAIAVTLAYATANHLRSLLDLRRVGGALTIGGAAQLQQGAPGLPQLESVYGVTPAAFMSLPLGAQYSPLDTGAIQAAYVNTTDGPLANGDYRLLADRRHIFGWGNVIPVVSAKALAAEGPFFAATIQRVDAELTTPVMRQLNSAVDVAKQDPAAVAKQFLETHGLLTPGVS
ncbi:MAG: glycine betaine ABC transporter substrate-binding protein [Solirubrobacteraceae bacterium]